MKACRAIAMAVRITGRPPKAAIAPVTAGGRLRISRFPPRRMHKSGSLTHRGLTPSVTRFPSLGPLTTCPSRPDRQSVSSCPPKAR
jgi:hypothetical protein